MSTTRLPPFPIPAVDRLRAIAEQDQSLHAWTCLAKPSPSVLAGPLSGLDFGVKDVIDVAGLPTRCGSTVLPDTPALSDADCVAALRAAGAQPLGKTVTAEFAHVTPGPTRNPANPAHTPGGSSSGSAAAVAAGMVPFALGTQTGGSIIRPAAYCGVVGFKPTFGQVSRQGMRVMCPSLDVIGWHTPDVRLAARVANILLPHAAPTQAESSGALRIGFLAGHPGYALAPSAAAALTQARVDLESHGHCLLPVPSPEQVQTLLDAHSLIVHVELSRSLRTLLSDATEALSPALQDAIRTGASIPEDNYQTMLRVRDSVTDCWDRMTGSADLLLASSVTGPAPRGLKHTGQSGFNKAWSLLGWPCIHLPTTTNEDGLPLGILLVARPGHDHDLLSWAERLHPVMDRRRSSSHPSWHNADQSTKEEVQ